MNKRKNKQKENTFFFLNNTNIIHLCYSYDKMLVLDYNNYNI